MQALFGSRLSANINLIAQILILIGLWLGAYFARRKQISTHQNIQTTLVIANTFCILFVMATSFYSYVIAGGTVTGTVAVLMMIHGAFGLVAELTGVYLILRMSTKILPGRLRVSNFKRVMQGLLGLWTIVVVGGLAIYYVRYLAPEPVLVNPLTPFVHAVDDVQIHSDEMAVAASRGELATAKRHAEHLVNLIVGKSSPDYGDVDGDGNIEDPGDGIGAVVYLQRVRNAVGQSGGDPTKANAILDQINAVLTHIVAYAKVVVKAQDTAGLTQPVQESSTLVVLLRGSSDPLINQLAQAMGSPIVRPTAVVGTVPSGPAKVTVNIQNFAFDPKTLTVKQGTTIIFINHDNAKHTVTSDSGKFDSGDINPGQSYPLKMDEAGTYPYFCVFHGDKGGVDMAGTIVVTP
jgi:plastocyanin